MWKHIKGRIGGWILGGLFALLIIEMVLISPSVLDPTPDKRTDKLSDLSQSDTAAQVMVGINVVEIREQKKDWELWAERATSQFGQGDLDLEKVKIRFFGPEGIEYVVTGERGTVSGDTKDMQIMGAVVMESSNGYNFQTQNITYTSTTRTLHTTAQVDVKGPLEPQGGRLQLAGDGMEAALVGETMKLLKNVTASKKVHQRNGAVMAIRSGAALLSSRSREISFSDKVFISLEDVKVSGPSAHFVYDKSGKVLKEVELAGGVRVSDWDKFATAERVKLNLDKNQYIFKGRPRVVQDSDELFGDEIVFLNGGKQVKVKNARVRISRERLEEIN